MTSCTLERIAPLAPVVGSEVAVPLVEGGSVRYANLDVAASAPALTAVSERVEQLLPWYASVHRGAGFHSQVSTAAYETARESVRTFVGGRDTDVVVFTRNTTDSLNLLASAIPAGGRVLVLDIEHHANLLPWRSREVTTLPAADTLAETILRLELELAVGEYALLAVTGVSNVTGESLPLTRLAELAHRYGARLAVDGAQLVPHRRVDLGAQGIDYLAFSGHKLYAPFGAGVVIGARDWLDGAPAYLAGGGAVRQVGPTSVEWVASPERHEAGTPNTVGVAALAAACDVLAALDPDELDEHERTLHGRLIDGLSAINGVHIARIWSDSQEPAGIVTFAVDGYQPGLIAAVLSAEYGIGVRDGRFCAHPLLARFGLREGAVRASIGLNSSSDDVDRLAAAVDEIVRVGPRWTYQLDDGRYLPDHDPRRLPAFLGGGPLGRSAASLCQP
jgi:selenocysteine lyase/cysteine desulfurase